VNHRGERAARANEERLDALLQHTHDILVVLTDDGRAAFVSSAVTAVLGYGRAELAGTVLAERIEPQDRPTVTAMVDRARREGGAVATGVRMRTAGGGLRWFDISATDLRRHRDVRGLLLNCYDVTDRQAITDELTRQAGSDPLTGLPNRAAFARELQRLGAAGGRPPFTVLFVDLDRFKAINDTFGHEAGDRVLVSVADRLQNSIREGADRPGDLVCRLGGDEFAVVLAGDDPAVAARTAERLLRVVQEPIVWRQGRIQVGATIGVAQSRHGTGQPDTVVRHADQAMYRAKAAGRGRFAMFTPQGQETRS
jgi:diguanylate cyclase (GGDEF)-like protein/PAS domain S-box-containing protein